jgi:hypothetical protein
VAKCVVCHADVVDNDLCNQCEDFKAALVLYASSSKRRALITGTLLQCRFNIVDLEEDRECPINCGFCCRTSWGTVLSLRYKFGEDENGKPCPHLTPNGCELPREKRPNGCVSFLCPLAWVVQADRMSVRDARRLLASCGGDSEKAAEKLRSADDAEKRKWLREEMKKPEYCKRR